MLNLILCLLTMSLAQASTITKRRLRHTTTTLHAQELPNTPALPQKTESSIPKKIYTFSNEPIDVVFVCHPKDAHILDLAIDGIKVNGKNIRNILVVSAEKLTDTAQWFDEAQYPFNKASIALEIFHGDQARATAFIEEKNSRIGWIYQQLLKLYAPFVIPNISSNVLIVDADTIFLTPVEFMDQDNCPLFNPATEYHQPYFEHASRLLPWLTRVYPEYSGVAHHMLFQRPVLEELFSEITAVHALEPWRALCRCINLEIVSGSSLSEYEIYFNFIFSKTDQAKIRPLQWYSNRYSDNVIESRAESNFNYISCHTWT